MKEFTRKTLERKPINHLAPGVSPIMVWIGVEKDFSAVDFSTFQPLDLGVESDGTLGISPVNEDNKESGGFLQCTGLIVSGKDKSTGKYISFMTHQEPSEILGVERESFEKSIKRRLLEVASRCVPGTVDAVIVGGDYFSDPILKESIKNDYLGSVKLLADQIVNVLGFEPTVINGPKMYQDVTGDSVFYDNSLRRVYFARTKINEDIGDFLPSQLEQK